jgi:hypothetical protein
LEEDIRNTELRAKKIAANIAELEGEEHLKTTERKKATSYFEKERQREMLIFEKDFLNKQADAL